jgi:hypothetical protein
LERERAEVMGLDALSDAQLYMRSSQQYDDSLPEKKMSFCFNHRRNLDVGSRSKKFGSLKDFEIHSVQEKEPEISGWELLSRSGRSST